MSKAEYETARQFLQPKKTNLAEGLSSQLRNRHPCLKLVALVPAFLP